jgi:carboxyl-terminal processing protease
MMRTLKFSIVAGMLVTIMVTSCNFRPFDSDKNEAWYDFAAACLDVFFIYRDRLPSDLYAYSSPQALYESVNDRFTVFLNPAEAKGRYADLTTEQGGIGISFDSVANGYVIKKVYANTPGESAGLQALDTILRVDGFQLAGVSIETTLSKLKGEIGTDVVLRVKRGGNQLNITVTRGLFRLPSVEVDSLDSITAYIQLMAFFKETVVPGGSAQEFSEALDTTAWAEYTILDLRGNGGGYIDQCIDIVGDLVPPETPVVNIRERIYDDTLGQGVTMDTVYVANGTGKAVGRTLYILVDGYTASASEMLVSCLRDRDRVTVIGTHTFGKGKGQIMLEGPDSVLAVVTCMTISPANDSAAAYDDVGIVPDVVTADTNTFDVALEMITDVQPAKRRVAGGGKRRGRRDVDPVIIEPSAIVTGRQ